MHALAQDLSHAVRVFVRRPALTAVAILSLAVATGPNAALFSAINGLFLRPLPVSAPEELLAITAARHGHGQWISYPDWLDLRSRVSSLSGLMTWERAALPLSFASDSDLLAGNYVAPGYFATLGVTPAIGRLFSDERDAQPGAALPLVISYSYWQRRFHGAVDVVGTMAQMEGRSAVIIGVATRDFRGLDVHFPVDAWMTFSAAEAIGHLNPATLADRERGRFSNLVGRLRTGATAEQVSADLAGISRDLSDAYPSTNQGRLFHAHSYTRDRSGKALLAGSIVMGLVTLVLLVACANVAGLLLSLAELRRGEIAIRLSLGASRWRLIRQLLTESLLIWMAGAGLGLLLAVWLMHIPIAPPLLGGVTLDYNIRFDTTVFLYTVLVAAGTSMLFGLAPALQATKADMVPAAKSSRGQSPAGHSRTRKILIAGQIAVSQFLLAAAVLGLRSYTNVQQFQPGFDVHKNVLAISLVSRTVGPGPARSGYETLTERLRALPGVVEVSAAASIPLSGSGDGAMRKTTWPGRQEELPVRCNVIAARYFNVMGIQLLRGRDFDMRDTNGSSPAVIVNDTLARAIAPDGNALERWIRVAGIARQVIGVAEDGRYRSLRDDSEPYLYVPASRPGLLLLEVSGDSAEITRAIHETVSRVVPDLYVANVTTLGQVMRFARYGDELAMKLVGVLGALAMFLTGIGVYGMISHWVTSRTHEIGIRVAIGAPPRAILVMVLSEAMRLTATGAVVGLVAAVIGGFVIASSLFGLSPADPRSYLAGAVAVAVFVVAACAGPALRASTVQPVIALRHD